MFNFNTSLTPNYAGQHNFNMVAHAAAQTPSGNMGVSATGFGSVMGATGMPMGGGALGMSINPLSASLSQSFTPGIGNQMTGAGTLHVIQTPNHQLNTSVFRQENNLNNGNNFVTKGAIVDYKHSVGHAASVVVGDTPAYNQKNVIVSGTANVWKSDDKQQSLDIVGTVNKTIGGPNDGKVQNSIGVGTSINFK